LTPARLPPVQAALEAGRAQGLAPALAAAVRAGGQLVHRSAHGSADSRPVGPDDLFDVASLTKVLATGSVSARLAASGALNLDAPVARWLPAFRGEKGAITARHLLAHSSGLPAWLPLHASARGPAAFEAAIGATPLLAPPGARAGYSDLGFMALGLCLERAGGAPLDRLFEREVARPLGLSRSIFPATATGTGPAAGFVPTLVRETGDARLGEVHDENARALGGVAGHAGLFASAADVAAVGQAWLEALGGRASFLPPALAAAFAARDPTPGSSRGLAWDHPSGTEPAIGSRLGRGPRGAIGHLGFTGCSLWIDLDAGLVAALLTNHCPRVGEVEPIRAFRRAFHDAVAEGLGIG